MALADGPVNIHHVHGGAFPLESGICWDILVPCLISWRETEKFEEVSPNLHLPGEAAFFVHYAAPLSSTQGNQFVEHDGCLKSM